MVEKAFVYFLQFSAKSINHVLQLFSDKGSIKKWNKFKREYNLRENSYSQMVLPINSIPERWKL